MAKESRRKAATSAPRCRFTPAGYGLAMVDRTAHLVGSIDLATAKGLELGPLNNPVVRKSDGDVRYLDHVDTEALRARYASHEGFDLDSIVPIDYVSWTGSIRSAVGDDGPFDYVIASHVIEHVPDLIRWLARRPQCARRWGSALAGDPRPPPLLRCVAHPDRGR